MRQNDECHTPPLFCLVFIDRFSSLVILPGLNFDFFKKKISNEPPLCPRFGFEKQNIIFISQQPMEAKTSKKQNFHRMNAMKASYKLGNFFGKSLKNRSFSSIQIFPFFPMFFVLFRTTKDFYKTKSKKQSGNGQELLLLLLICFNQCSICVCVFCCV